MAAGTSGGSGGGKALWVYFEGGGKGTSYTGYGGCDPERRDDSKVFGLHNGSVELPLTGIGKGGAGPPMKSQFGRV